MALGLIDHRISYSASGQTQSEWPPSHGDCSLQVMQATYDALGYTTLNEEPPGLVSIPGRKDILYHLLRGVDQLISQGVKVICLPLGFAKVTPLLETLVNTCEEKEILLVAAIGNKGPGRFTYPAAYPGVLAVGATDLNGNAASYSGSMFQNGVCIKPELLATGVHVPSSFSRGEQISKGTSMACARVAAVANAMVSTNPKLTGQALKALLIESARTVNGSRYGVLDMEKALRLTKAWRPTDSGQVAPQPSDFEPDWIDQRLNDQCMEATHLGRSVKGLLATKAEEGMSRLLKSMSNKAITVHTSFAHFCVAHVEAQPELIKTLFTHPDLTWASAVDVNYFD